MPSIDYSAPVALALDRLERIADALEQLAGLVVDLIEQQHVVTDDEREPDGIIDAEVGDCPGCLGAGDIILDIAGHGHVGAECPDCGGTGVVRYA